MERLVEQGGSRLRTPRRRGTTAEDAAPAHLLRLIFAHQPLSQSNLRDLSGLSMSTISSTVKRLASHGIVRELGQRKEQMGRPQVLLGVEPGFAAVIGVQLNAERNLIVVTDLAGRLLSEHPLRDGPLTPDQLAQALSRFRKANAGMPIAAVGLAIAGLVDADAGTCVASTVLDWRDVPIAAILSRRLQLPVHVENDANALSLATLVFGQLGGVRNAAIVTVGEGIGAALIVDGKLHRGYGSAGEIGHFKITDDPTPECHCGQTGCLEMVASSRRVLRLVSEGTAGRIRASQLTDLDDLGDPEAERVLRRAGHQLGRMLAMLALTLDPDTVCLAMEPRSASRILVEETNASFQMHRLRLGRRPTPLRLLTDIDRMWALGAAGIAVGKIIDDIAAGLSDEAQQPRG